MAGRPIRRLMIAELERQARDAGPGEGGEPLTALDIVCQWTADGKTFAELARELTDATGQTISAGIIGSWVNSTKEGTAKIAAARALAAHIHAEQSVQAVQDLVDSKTEVTREEVALVKALADTKQWLAAKWNRPVYGGESMVQINNTQINAADAHLAALAQRKQIKATAQPVLPPAGADYEVVSD